MKQYDDIELPLYNAFVQLMQLEKDQTHKSIEPTSFLLLTDTLRNGYMLNSKEELIFFCKKIWLKPFHLNNPVVSEKVLEEILMENLASYSISAKDQKQEKNKTGEKSFNEKKNKENKEKENMDVSKAATDTGSELIQKQQIANKESIKSNLVLSIEEVDGEDSVSGKDYSNLFNNNYYQFNYEYLPVSRRFIEQTVRSLRYKVKGSGRKVMDIHATVRQTAAKGFFEDCVMREEDGFITRWTLLLDNEGSMVAFHDLQKAIVEAAFSGTIKNEGDVFYFHNIPAAFLFTNPQRTRSKSFARVASGPARNLLIISDAGAARGFINEDRIQDTYTMLYKLRKHRIAWLNPLPKERWSNTSAATIASFVNMFETGDDNSDTMGNIVQLLKSKIVSKTTI